MAEYTKEYKGAGNNERTRIISKLGAVYLFVCSFFPGFFPLIIKSNKTNLQNLQIVISLIGSG